MGGRTLTLLATRHRRLIFGALLATGCASAPSGNPADESATPSAPGIDNVTERGPRVLNMTAFLRTLMREMPEELERAGIDGYAKVWLYFDVRGRILERKIHATSGNRTLDRVILQAARVLRFSSEGRSDPVWVLVDLGYRRR